MQDLDRGFGPPRDRLVKAAGTRSEREQPDRLVEISLRDVAGRIGGVSEITDQCRTREGLIDGNGSEADGCDVVQCGKDLGAQLPSVSMSGEPPRRVRRLRSLGRLGSCQGTHTSGIRLS